MADLTYWTWQWALAYARRGKPADLARLVCDGPPPADLRHDVELIIANPVQKRVAHRTRKLGDAQVMMARDMYRAWTNDDREPMPKGQAIEHLALLMGCSPGTMRDVIGYRKTYARRR